MFCAVFVRSFVVVLGRECHMCVCVCVLYHSFITGASHHTCMDTTQPFASHVSLSLSLSLFCSFRLRVFVCLPMHSMCLLLLYRW